MAARRRAAHEASPLHDRDLVGRGPLLEELTAAAAAAAGGSGSLVLLTGEAGIGKTSVARALARRAGPDLTVLWGTCAADRGAPPFWPWREIVDIDTGPHDADEPVPPAIGHHRFAHLDELRSQLLGRSPSLVVIEDLHWADVSSVLLLAHVGPALIDAPIMIVGTLRTGEPLDPHLGEVIEQVRHAAEVRALSPLPHDAVRALIRQAGIGLDAGTDELVLDRTGGNPLFVTELLRAVRTAAPDQPPHEVVTADIPARVAELIAHRLQRLPGAVAGVVSTASVIGADGDVRTLAGALGSEVTAVVELLEQAGAARLLELTALGRWQFSHQLVRDAVYAELTTSDRARLHAAVLDTLAADPGTSAGVLAHHALAALPLFDPERAVALAARAGAEAFEQHAYEEAVRWFRQALTATTPDLAPRWRADLLVVSGEAHRQMGALDDARAAFLEAASLTDDAEVLARAALGYADPGADLGIAYRTEVPATAALLQRAIAARTGPVSATGVALAARLAAELYFSDEHDRARRTADAALGDAQELGDPRALGAASAVIHDAFVVGQADLDALLRGSEQLLDWARQTGSPSALLTAHRARVFDLLAAGDLASMDAEILAFRRVAEPLRSPGYLWWPAIWSAMRSLLHGQHQVAEEQAVAAYELGAGSFPTLAMMNLSFLLFFLRREQGRFGEMELATREVASSQADIPALRVALAFLLAETGKTDEARGLLSAIAERDLDGLRDRNWPASWFQLARASYLVGDTALARTLLTDDHRPAERCVMVSLATACLGSTELASAWLLHTVGDADAAEARYIEAEVVNARLGARSWLAQARVDRAALLIARARGGDRDQAGLLLELAADAAQEIGLPTLHQQTDALRSRLDASPQPGPWLDGDGAPSSTFRRSGAIWELEFAGRRTQIAHTRGLSDLAFLLSRPEQPVSVLELVGDGPPVSATRGATALDERARREIRARLRDLDEQVAAAEADGDGERAALAREQRQLLAEAVARDLGLGGRVRRLDDPIERARKTVSTRIRRTISAVGRAHPELGRHLERSIDTGAWCAYRPEEPQRWTT